MPKLTPAQRARILDAFLTTMDELPYVERPTEPAWEFFYYEGYIALAGLVHVAKVIAEMHLEDTAPSPSA